MKRNFLLAVALTATSVAFSQQKEKKAPPPPPPPPMVEVAEMPAPPPPAPSPELPKDYQAFLERNPTVSSLGWSKDNVVHVYLKSGQKNTYHLNNPVEADSLKASYGELPMAPPPPPVPKAKKKGAKPTPPPPPAPPVMSRD